MGGDSKNGNGAPGRVQHVHVAPREKQRVLFSSSQPKLKLRLQDAAGAPLKNMSYSISWRDTEGTPILGSLDGNGILTEPIPQGAALADLVVGPMTDMSIVFPRWKLTVRVTPLPAPDSLAGAIARLNNLGYVFVPFTVPLAVPDFEQWAKSNTDAAQLTAMTYFRTKQVDPPVTYGDVYRAIAKDHDGQ